MSSDPSPLKYIGTQSKETVNMAAAMARDSLRATERAADQSTGTASDEVGDASTDVHATGSKMGAAANRAMNMAKRTLCGAAETVRDRARTVVATRAKEDPVRTILIAAGAGALVMVLIAKLARSGVRRVEREVQK